MLEIIKETVAMHKSGEQTATGVADSKHSTISPTKYDRVYWVEGVKAYETIPIHPSHTVFNGLKYLNQNKLN